MHELGITRNIVAIVRENCENRKVIRVKLEIGKLTAVIPDAIRFCFEVCTQETELAGAILEIDEKEGLGRCRHCSAELLMANIPLRCACGSIDIECVAGMELLVKELEVA